MRPLSRHVRSVDDVLDLLDGLFPANADRWTTAGGVDYWDQYYADREREVPFFVNKPDEHLARYVESGRLTPGRALDLGCGPGRNAVYLASHGFQVDAVDISPDALAWTGDRAREAGVEVGLHRGDAFALTRAELTGPYDLVVDSGFFHHLPPHRRISYLQLLERTLAFGGHLVLAAFAAWAPGSGSPVPDPTLYRDGKLYGGLAYTSQELRWIFAGLTELEIRSLREQPPEAPYYGPPFLLGGLFQRDAETLTLP
ncbi:class I SAM-dependent methyltransferase [Streptomyces sedi]|uniref:Class I SAM-dependent methyltransferase n=1 Tax=Streptomyces sedi TaxID=555059 RepID=A0A5C4V8I7_9ACTN|nr:class I SAM-dependent methyltransferase [Streptomyces sedi]TNM32252.1 class I SAM-dependent methyltransferase [Streptomyces sedi]